MSELNLEPKLKCYKCTTLSMEWKYLFLVFHHKPAMKHNTSLSICLFSFDKQH